MHFALLEEDFTVVVLTLISQVKKHVQYKKNPKVITPKHNNQVRE